MCVCWGGGIRGETFFPANSILYAASVVACAVCGDVRHDHIQSVRRVVIGMLQMLKLKCTLTSKVIMNEKREMPSLRDVIGWEKYIIPSS